MEQHRTKKIFCILGFAMLFFLVGAFLLKEKKFYAKSDWMSERTELQLVNTNYSEEEKEQIQKRYEEELVDATLDLVDWTGREEERARYREELLRK